MENTDILDEYHNHDSSGETGLYISKETYDHLNTAAKWGNILAIIGFVLTGLGGLIGLLLIGSLGFMASMGDMGGLAAFMWISIVFYFGILAFYIVPLLYLSRFSKNMKTALYNQDQGNLTVSFENLGKLFKFFGILTVVVIGIYVFLSIIGSVMTATMASSLQNF